jgi:hypothetical protein
VPQATTTTTGPKPTTTTTGITQVPVVGPKENIVLVIAISLLAYFVYRIFARRKAK